MRQGTRPARRERGGLSPRRSALLSLSVRASEPPPLRPRVDLAPGSSALQRSCVFCLFVKRLAFAGIRIRRDKGGAELPLPASRSPPCAAPATATSRQPPAASRQAPRWARGRGLEAPGPRARSRTPPTSAPFAKKTGPKTSSWNVTDWGLALGAYSPVLVPSDMYEGTFAKKNRVRGLPAPPVAPRSWVP
jgi:hypothetical protein